MTNWRQYYGERSRHGGETYRAFTLIEMLIVIAVVAVLAALLFPVLSKTRARARQTQCLSNLRQLSLATFQYAQDSDDHYPTDRFSEIGLAH